MRGKCFLLLKLLSFFMMSSVAMAETLPICNHEALEQANTQYLQEMVGYMKLFSNQDNHKAVAELSKIKPKAAFSKKHATEINHFISDESYQPSEQFCKDAYTNLEELREQISEIVKKHQIND